MIKLVIKSIINNIIYLIINSKFIYILFIISNNINKII